VTHWDLKRKGLSAKSATTLSDLLRDPDCPFTALHLERNGFRHDCTTVLGGALGENASLRRVDVGECRLMSAFSVAWSVAERGHDAFVQLELCRNEIGPHGAKAIAELLPRMPALRRLSLSGNQLGDEGAISLAFALRTPGVQLTFLDLSANALTYISMRHLLRPSTLLQPRLVHPNIFERRSHNPP